MHLSPFLLLLLAACGSLLPPGPAAPDRYWLSPAPLQALAGPGPSALAVELRVVPGLDSDRVLVLAEDARLAPLAGAAWAEFLPDVLRSVVGRSLSAGGYAVRAGHARAGDCRLDLEVTEFFLSERAGGRWARVGLEGRYGCGQGTQPLAVRAERPATGGPAQAVAALQAALDECLVDLHKAMRAP